MPKTKRKGKKSHLKRNIALIAIVCLACLGIAYFNGWLNPVSTPTQSSIILKSDDGEDVSWVNVLVEVPKGSAEFDGANDYEEICDPDNFKDFTDVKPADRINIDIRDHDFIWITIKDDSGYFEEASYLILGGEDAENHDLELNVYHLPSDVNFNMFDVDTMEIATVIPYTENLYTFNETSGEWISTANNTISLESGDFEIIGDVPRASTSELHRGADWEVSTNEYNAMTTTEQAEMQDQRNYRTEAKIYNYNDDTSKKYNTDLRKITESFAFRITMNDTIVIDTNLEISIDSQYEDDWEIQTTGVYVYLISLRNLNAPIDLIFSLTLTNLTTSTMQSGRVSIPSATVDSFSALSTIGA